MSLLPGTKHNEPYCFATLWCRMRRKAMLLRYSLEDAEDIASECVRIKIARWGKAKQTIDQTFTDACRIEGHIDRPGHVNAKLENRRAVTAEFPIEIIGRICYHPNYEAAIDLLREMQIPDLA